MKKYDCVVLTYNVPHRKTYDVLCLLRTGGVKNVLVYAVPMHYKKRFHPIYEHRPPVYNKIDIEVLSLNLGYEYICSDNYDNIKVDRQTPLLVCGAGIIPQDIVEQYTIINAHPGYIPLARGLDALKWEITEDKPIGVTTHLIGKEVDAGEVIERKIIPVYKNDTFHSLAQRVYENEVIMLVDALNSWNDKHIYIGAGDNELHKRMPEFVEEHFMHDFEKYINKWGIDKINFNMSSIYENWDFDIIGVSNIDYPIDNTVILLKNEDKDKIVNLRYCKYCVVVSDEGICPDKNIAVYNFFITDAEPEKKFRELISNMVLST